MKNINESISFESTLGSPSKPHPNDIVQKPKQIFLVNCVKDNINLNHSVQINLEKKYLKKKKSLKSKKKKINVIKDKNIEYHNLLDFDSLFQDIIIGQKNKNKKSFFDRNANDKKLIGSKRIRFISNKNSSIKSKNIKLIIINVISIEINLNRYKNNFKRKSYSNHINHYDIYDINNFCSNTMRIKEKSISYNVICPSFKELPDNYFEDNNIEVSFYF